jgi:hypothetical protein
MPESSVAEWIAAVSGIVTALAAVAAVAIAYFQLGAILDERRLQDDRDQKWQTISVCQRYFTDPTLVIAKRKIFKARSKVGEGKISDQPSIRQCAIFIVNFLDSIAIGVRQGAYSKSIVKDNLGSVMVDAVIDLLDGGLGDFKIHPKKVKDLVALAAEFRQEFIRDS